MQASEKIFECRELVSSFFGSSSPENVVFTQNATYALNMAIKGLIRQGDHVLISDMEHNSVFRPIAIAAKSGYIDYDVFPTVKNGRSMSADEIRRGILSLIRPGKTRLLVAAHAPNITSALRPINMIGDLCRRNGILFVCDAAQSAGHVPIDIKAARIDVLCAPAHKGLFGIQGCGFMLLSDECPPLSTIVEGGNGVNSLDSDMPELAPERYESGTLPTPAIAALSEGVKFLSNISPSEIRRHEEMLFLRLYDALTSEKIKAKIYMPSSYGSVLLFNIPNRPSDEIGRLLSKQGICVRSGYHCSALGHKTLGTLETGALRASFSIFNTKEDIDALYRALVEVI
jgi:selenocysteine lyase/cysteine desulfurase